MVETFQTIGGFLRASWWLFLPGVLFALFWPLWVFYIRRFYVASIEWDLFEIRIPKEVEKTPKAMEQVFAGIHGIHSSPNLKEKYWDGETQKWVSLEIVGIEGETHFFIRAPKQYRRLIEAQIYAQYPEAEIFDALDYTQAVPRSIPNESYDLWGTELILAKEDAYPIRTYIYFEEVMLEQRIDPLAALSELLSSTQQGEQMWLQFLTRPVKENWKDAGEKLVAKLVKKKKPKGGGFLASLSGFINEFFRILFGPQVTKERKKENKKEEKETVYGDITAGMQNVIKAIESNISKHGFEERIRFLYIARTDIFSKANVSAMMGVFKQFGSNDLNAFKPNKKVSTKIDYFFKRRREYLRKRKIFRAYRRRLFRTANPSIFTVDKPYVLNTEELATVYHFPGIVARAPLMPRIEAKKAEPPQRLPRVV